MRSRRRSNSAVVGFKPSFGRSVRVGNEGVDVTAGVDSESKPSDKRANVRVSGAPTPASGLDREVPVQNPLEYLHPSAARILTAAEQLLAESGLRKLTFQAISAKSGEPRGLIYYHFHSKSVLLSTLVDLVLYRACFVRASEAEAATPYDKLEQFIQAIRSGVASRDTHAAMRELFPYILANSVLRARVSRVFAWYCEINQSWLGAPPARSEREVMGVASIITALTSGLAMDLALRGDEMDIDAIFEALNMLLGHFVGVSLTMQH